MTTNNAGNSCSFGAAGTERLAPANCDNTRHVHLSIRLQPTRPPLATSLLHRNLATIDVKPTSARALSTHLHNAGRDPVAATALLVVAEAQTPEP